MKAPLKKRGLAYLIDIIILLIVLGLINIFLINDHNSLNKEMNMLELNYSSGDISLNEYISDLGPIYKQVDKSNIIINILNAIFIVVYFVIVPYFNHGQTIGKKIMGLEVRARSNQKITLWQLLVRNLIINGLIYLLAVIIGVYMISPNIYFWFISILGMIQIGLVLTSMFMVTYRKDKKGLHDLIARTWVASER